MYLEVTWNEFQVIEIVIRCVPYYINQSPLSLHFLVHNKFQPLYISIHFLKNGRSQKGD